MQKKIHWPMKRKLLFLLNIVNMCAYIINSPHLHYNIDINPL